MPRYLIQRNIPGAGRMTPAELKAASEKSCSVLRKLGPEIQWVESFVSDDGITCVYIAENEELIRRHAQDSGFPADRITRVRTVIDPTTAD